MLITKLPSAQDIHAVLVEEIDKIIRDHAFGVVLENATADCDHQR